MKIGYLEAMLTPISVIDRDLEMIALQDQFSKKPETDNNKVKKR